MQTNLPRQPAYSLLWIALLASPALAFGASDWDELKVKRQELYEFAAKPVVTRKGDRVEIAFESKGACDVTVAIENTQGQIIRHLASGVLGTNAPAPFQKDTLKQRVVWDGKDDQGRYSDDKENLAVRVALGLRPQFERTHFWSPHKRPSGAYPLVRAAPEGVYVFDGQGVDHLRLFDHEGKYLRTIYPFPADKLEKVQGLKWLDLLPDHLRVPAKNGEYLCTLLSSGVNAYPGKFYGLVGRAAHTMALHMDRIYLPGLFLNRFATDGSSGGMTLLGPKTSYSFIKAGQGRNRGDKMEASPTSSAVSPDGKWLYLTGYIFKVDGYWECLHGVVRVDLEKEGEPVTFAGSMKQDDSGSGNDRFVCPISVACDAQGRVYVADYANDRIQIFSQDGKYLKSIDSYKPAQVIIHAKSSEIYAFSWSVSCRSILTATEKRLKDKNEINTIKVKPMLTRLASFEDPRQVSALPLPLPEQLLTYGTGEVEHLESPLTCQVEIDFHSNPPTFWVGREKSWGAAWSSANPYGFSVASGSWDKEGLVLLVEKNGTFEVKKDFGVEAAAAIPRLWPPHYGRQRLYVNPKSGKVYLAEQHGGFCFEELLEINPDSGALKVVPVPFSAEDMAFDLNGVAYLRGGPEVGRYDSETWREVPWDYGEEREKAMYEGDGIGKKAAPLLSGLPIATGNWHKGGMSVSAKGNIAVTCYFDPHTQEKRTDEARTTSHQARPYTPRMYPGKFWSGKCAIINVWDKHGKMICEDAIQGVGVLSQTAIDKDDALYVMGTGVRMLDGKRYFNLTTNTLMKFQPNKGKLFSASSLIQIPLTDADRPKTPPQLSQTLGGITHYPCWVEGMEWMYGGVGLGSWSGGLCSCMDSRFDLDYYARTFAPEPDRFGVAVLDTNGNLILRLGRYGNVDSDGPKSRVPLGGDEVGLMYAPYVATHTDRRLFIADIGNARIVSVKLDYHASEKVALKDVANKADVSEK